MIRTAHRRRHVAASAAYVTLAATAATVILSAAPAQAATGPVYAPAATITAGKCIDATTTAATIRLDNRASNRAVTYEVTKYAADVLSTGYVTVPKGTVLKQTVKARTADVQVTVSALDTPLRERRIEALYCKHTATVGNVARESATVKVTNRTDRAKTYVIATSNQDETAPQAWRLKVPAGTTKAMQIGILVEQPTMVTVDAGTRRILARAVWGNPDC